MIAASGDYWVDASSIMGLFSLDLTKPITLEFPKEEDAEDLKEQLQRFVLKAK